MFLLHFSFLSFVVTINSLNVDFNVQDNTLDGERLYGDLVEKAQSYGDCWKTAMSDLNLGCKRLTEEVQSRLALSFSNCFLKQAGLEPCHCTPDVPISNCLKNINDRVFSTYTEFFTHTHSICHYLQHREWQEEASKTVLLLTKNSQLVTRKLDDSFKSQSKILDLQQAALNEQKSLISSSKILKTELQESRESAKEMYKEFKTTTDEQKFLLFQVFSRVQNLQNFVLREFSGVYTVAFYILAATFIYISTSIPRTAEARIWLILIISMSATAEWILTTHTLQKDILEVNHEDVNELLYFRIWLCRKIVFGISFVILIRTYYCYKDYNAINNQLLQEIQQQNKELQNFIKGLGFHENIQTLMPLNSSTKCSSIMYETRNGKIATKTGINESDSSISIINTPIPQQVLSPSNFENKENALLSSTPIAGTTDQNNRNKTSGKFSWDETAIKLLLSLYKEKKDLMESDSFKKGTVWEMISEKMQSYNYSVSYKQCAYKYGYLCKSFEKMKDNTQRSRQKRMDFPFMDIMEDIVQK